MSTRAQDHIKKAYSTRMKQVLMTGPQAAQVYYGPAVRNPLKNPYRSSRIQAGKLSSEKFIFQKATKMDSPQRREFLSNMTIKSSPFDDVPSTTYNMPHVNKQAQ